MKNSIARPVTRFALATALVLGLAAPAAVADDTEILKGFVKAMSDYMAKENKIAFDFDSALDVVTTEGEVITLVSSGSVVLERPNRIAATRHGGFVNMEAMFDGKTFTVFGKNANAYMQVNEPGSTDDLIKVLQDKYGLPMPASDLLTSDPYSLMMDGVTEVKGIGTGVIGGVVCDHLAFRSEHTDWQIWIAQGDEPRPCRYEIVTKDVDGGPRYAIVVTDWKVGDAVPKTAFTFDNTSNAKKVDLDTIREAAGALPARFYKGAER